MTLYCATTNPGKLREFQSAAEDIQIIALRTDAPVPEETGATFEENAALKSAYYSKLTEGLLFADDSGLEVDALQGAPGVHSARYAGPHATDAGNNQLLLRNLKGIANRTARFACVIALASRGTVIATFRGTVEGEMLTEPQGQGGFGYDPLFFYPPQGRSFGEVALGDKMLLSHRAKALNGLFQFLRANPNLAEQSQ